MHHSLLATTAALLTACAATSHSAICDDASRSPCRSDLADITVVDRTTGERLTVYSHAGQRWVAGTPGHRYAISIRNRSPGRLLNVVAVDGINAISGETADWEQSGYVLSGQESFDVLGWRKSQERVADFIFTDLGDSYAARTGRPDDVGVIGVAVFREAAPVPPPVSSNEAPASGGGITALSQARPESRSEDRLGTGHGPSESSRVLTTSFERAQDRPDQVIAIRYDRREHLIAMGVIPNANAPRPFPGSASAGFVPDPPARW
ncbi:MAG TPA: hypothetical protein VH278_09555 [Burkholderiaceae bacterium]|nr:hypothetical protein [Burkholderiaceae bacterium]